MKVLGGLDHPSPADMFYQYRNLSTEIRNSFNDQEEIDTTSKLVSWITPPENHSAINYD
ncbi:hypothetical protein SESBI_47858 [Sesbania bispinosa]|nr:hypothetical protein SESBI_47858 [Sesbania bispinosa]